MALLRILLSLSIGVFSAHSFGQEQSFGSGAPQVAVAVEPTAPTAAQIQSNSTPAQYKLFGVPQNAQVSAAAGKLKTSTSNCDSRKQIADNICLESRNPDILKFVAENGQLLSMGLMVGASLGEQCKSLSETLNKANMVLSLYTAACKVAQAACESACKVVKTDVTQVNTAASTATGQISSGCSSSTVGAAVCSEQVTTAQTTTAKLQADGQQINAKTEKKIAECGRYKISTTNAMMGAITALKGFAQTKACEKANSDVNIAEVNCNDSNAPGYSTPNCMCARGEKSAAECQNINVDAATIKQATISAPKPISAADGAGTATGGLGSLGGDESAKVAATASSDSSAPPVDGGGGGMGGGGSGGGYGQDGAGGTRRLNTNILGGGFGGGGGGGGSGGGPGYGEMDPKLKSYMPGGANDPNRSIASQLAKEVTPQAGRTNWEKVRLRYRDNTGSLLNK